LIRKYDTYFVAAEKLKLNQINYEGFKVQRFSEKYFGSAKAHNKLLTNTIFYKAFSQYKYILIYHLDSLVFSDQLVYWCEKDYDCIAPPWMSSDYKWLENSAVGNGGFSLRKIESFIKLYSSKKYWQEPEELARKTCEKIGLPKQLFTPIVKQVFKLSCFNNMQRHLNYYLDQELSAEDRFISMYGNKYYPEINIAPAEEAIKFAFERYPRKYYEMNNNQLPFEPNGQCRLTCIDHWVQRFDVTFWEPHLLKPLNPMVNAG